MAAPEIVFIYVTCPGVAQASELGRALVDQKLAACVNIFPGMHSICRWEGEIETGSETAMFIKTTQLGFEAAAAFIRAHHPYDCPCIVSLPITNADPNYAAWIINSCTS